MSPQPGRQTVRPVAFLRLVQSRKRDPGPVAKMGPKRPSAQSHFRDCLIYARVMGSGADPLRPIRPRSGSAGGGSPGSVFRHWAMWPVRSLRHRAGPASARVSFFPNPKVTLPATLAFRRRGAVVFTCHHAGAGAAIRARIGDRQ